MLKLFKIVIFIILGYLSIGIVDTVIYCCLNIKHLKIEQIFNAGEMFFWLIVGIIFFAYGFRRSNRYRNLSYFLSVVFAFFGLSDNFEIHSGAWWRPWWLLAWKALCIGIFAVSLIYYIWNERRLKRQNIQNKKLNVVVERTIA